MCSQVIEVYAGCLCIIEHREIQTCSYVERENHTIEKRTATSEKSCEKHQQPETLDKARLGLFHRNSDLEDYDLSA